MRDALRYRGFRQNWNVGVIARPVADVAGLNGAAAQREALAAVCWMEEERGLFRADPFPLSASDGGLDIYFEQLRWDEMRGTIERVRFRDGSFGPVAPYLSEAHHLSYPFTLQEEGKALILPEQAEARLFAALDPQDAGLRKTVISGEPLLDSSILRYGGRYWLFATRLDKGENETLHLFHAEGLDGPWTPHPGNPVKRDARAARPAGHFFRHGNDWFRPAQNCSRYYGESIVINRIAQLDGEGFSEEAVSEIRSPPGWRYADGLHTISHCGDMTVIDAARMESKFAAFIDPLARFVRPPAQAKL